MYYMLELPAENNKLTGMRVNWFLRESFRDEWISKHPGTSPLDEDVAIFYMTRRVDWKKHTPSLPENVARTATPVAKLRKWYHEDMQTAQEPATV